MEFRTFVYALLAGTALAGCGLNNSGVAPELGVFNFPIALAVSAEPTPRYLAVANSNFDSRFEEGSLQIYDLAAVDTAIADTCAGSEQDCIVSDLRGSGVWRSQVGIGSSAADVAFSPDNDRVFVAVRSDNDISFVTLDPTSGELSCGGNEAGHSCAPEFRTTDKKEAEDRGTFLAREPMALQVGKLDQDFRYTGQGDYVLVAYRGGGVGLFADRTSNDVTAPVLLDASTTPTVDTRSLQFDANTGLAWVTSVNSAVLARVGVVLGEDSSSLGDSFTYDARDQLITGIDNARDIRAIEFGTAPDGSQTVFALTRRPESLIIAKEDPTRVDELKAIRNVAVGSGASRLAKLDFEVRGEQRSLLFVSCFESREIYVIDGSIGRVLGVVYGFNGPFDVALDPGRQRLYVADFRSSVIRVVDISPSVACLENVEGTSSCEPRVLVTLGDPNLVTELI